MTSHQIRFDADLIRRYDRAGPRYTSYPRRCSSPTSSAERVQAAALASNQDRSRGRSRSTCTSRSARAPAFTAAARSHHRANTRAEAYLYRLHREIELQGQLYGTRPRGRAAALRRRHAHFPHLARVDPVKTSSISASKPG